MLKKPWKQQKSSAMAATNFSEASINDSTWIPVLKDLLLDCRNRVVVLQCGGKKMRWLKKKNPISAPWGSWVQITESHHHSLSQLSGVFAEFGGWQINRKWISTQKQKWECPKHVQSQQNLSDTLGSTTLITYKEARKTPRHQVWKAQAMYFYPAVLPRGFSLILNAGGRSSMLLPRSFFKG